MIRICAGIPNSDDGISFYRSMGPFSSMRGEIELVFPQSTNWVLFKSVDLVFLSRPFTPEHAETIRQAHFYGKKVWIDYDDDLLHVPLDNPNYHMYASEEVRRSVLACMKTADVITVSSEALRDLMTSHGAKDARIVPNAFDDFAFDVDKRARRNNPKDVVMWRGSMCHDKDWVVNLQSLSMAAKANPTWSWHTLGWIPWHFVENLPVDRVKLYPPVGIFEYFELLATQHPSITIVPLVFHQFNVAKSNIAHIEGTWAGGVTVAPRMPEWMRPGVVTYTSPQDIGVVLTKVMRMSEAERAKLVEQAWEAIPLLSQTNKIRMQVIQDLVGDRSVA